jgi:lipopolysaccharide/colanic/teichoic acid biosynthesis glycosyltransferase
VQIFIKSAAMVHLPDSHELTLSRPESGLTSCSVTISRKQVFIACKRGFDVVFSLLFLPCVLVISVFLLVLNPFFNRGPLFYTQKRMGKDCTVFTIYKFRSMRPSTTIRRSANCPVETNRITRLGCWIRQTRIDELPQLLNVLKGDMSLIGPRPDFIDHALTYIETVPGYHARHMAKPGISGLAQVRLGYIEGEAATRHKARIDNFYIANMGFGLDLLIFIQTISVILNRFGAK